MNGSWMPPKVDYLALLKVGESLLSALGYDANSPGLVETPRRFADAWKEFIDYDPGKIDTLFEFEGSTETAIGQMVVVSNMRVWSYCEHHLLPFWANISIGYRPDGKVLGLSKFARIAHKCAHRLQLQERLVTEIADEVVDLVKTGDVIVYAEGEHLCMTMRGARTPARMISLLAYGTFQKSDEQRLFVDLVKSR